MDGWMDRRLIALFSGFVHPEMRIGFYGFTLHHIYTYRYIHMHYMNLEYFKDNRIPFIVFYSLRQCRWLCYATVPEDHRFGTGSGPTFSEWYISIRY